MAFNKMEIESKPMWFQISNFGKKCQIHIKIVSLKKLRYQLFKIIVCMQVCECITVQTVIIVKL